MQERKFELRSYEVQEILSLVPHWIIRWGIVLIFLIVLAILFVSWLIKYPEIIKSRITISTHNSPVRVIAKRSGKLAKLFVKENEFVKATTCLAVIENPANYDDVLNLKNQLKTVKTLLTKPDELNIFDFDKNFILGELQNDFFNFMQDCLNYKFLTQTNYYISTIKSLNAQIAYYKEVNDNLKRQRGIQLKELELAQKNYNNDKTLFEKGLISEADIAKSESIYLQKKFSMENAENSIITNNIQLTEYRKNITDLNQNFIKRKRSLILSIRGSYENLQSKLAMWEQKYILKAPIDGYVSFFKFWSDNQHVNMGDEVMTIGPIFQDIVGRIYMSGTGSGKIKVGQKINIKFDSYPSNEFGSVEGRIESISLILRDNQYLINVRLPKGLLTSYNKTLEFKQEMQGNADIITEDLRLIERIFNQLRYIFASSVSFIKIGNYDKICNVMERLIEFWRI